MKLKVIAVQYLEGEITATECRDKICLALAGMVEERDIEDCITDLCTAIHDTYFGTLQD